MTNRQRFAIVGSGIVALVFTLVSCLAIAGSTGFRPIFYFGTQAYNRGGQKLITHAELVAINQMAIIQIAKITIIMIVLAELHRVVQRFLRSNRPTGGNIHPHLGMFDLVTSLAPPVVAGLTFLVSRMVGSFDPWWFWFQWLLFIIVVSAVWEDIGPSWRYFLENHHRLRLPTSSPQPVVVPAPAPSSSPAVASAPATPPRRNPRSGGAAAAPTISGAAAPTTGTNATSGGTTSSSGTVSSGGSTSTP